MKRVSLIRQAFLLLSILILLVLTVFALYCGITYSNARQGAVDMTDRLLGITAAQLEAELKRADTLLQNVVLDRADQLDLLQSPQERERYFAAQEIYNAAHAVLQTDPSVAMIAVYDGSSESWIDSHLDQHLSFTELKQLEEHTKALLERGRRTLNWEAVPLESHVFLCRYYLRGSHIAVIYFRADVLLPLSAAEENERITWLLLSGEDEVLAESAGGEVPGAVGRRLEELDLRRSIVLTQALENTGFRLAALMPRTSLIRQLRLSLLVLGLLIAMLLAFSVLLLRRVRREVIQPLRRITGQLEGMKAEDADLYLEGDCGTEELELMQDSFNRLMTDNVGLRFKNYRTQLLTQESELRCIRLQLRPHFFLNALTTISSLSMQGKNEEIKTYIGALSRNIRYMFKSGLHTVPLHEELSAVRNYFDMQELKYPGTVFFMLQQEPGTDNWPVPQMIIHTVLENEYKHAVSIGETLTILTNIFTLRQPDETLLCIEIEDDGKGYPPEVLDAGERRQGRDGSRVGLSSIERMLAIMYGRDDLMQLSNIEPHGAKTRFLIPAAAVNEYKDEE